MLFVDFLQGATEHHCLSRVRFRSFRIGVEHHDVADTEVGYVVVWAVGGEAQHHMVYPSPLHLRRAHQIEVAVDVSRQHFFLQRAVPYLRESRILFRLVAHFRHQVFRLDEGQEPQVISTFQGCRLLYRCQQRLQFRFFKLQPETFSDSLRFQHVGRQPHQYVQSPVCVAKLMSHHLVSYFYRLEHQRRRESQVQQSLAVFRIEQHGVHEAPVALILFTVVVAQEHHVKNQLHIMLFLLFRRVSNGVLRLARFLFDEQPMVQMQEVHTSLYAQHFREE